MPNRFVPCLTYENNKLLCLHICPNYITHKSEIMYINDCDHNNFVIPCYDLTEKIVSKIYSLRYHYVDNICFIIKPYLFRYSIINIKDCDPHNVGIKKYLPFIFQLHMKEFLFDYEIISYCPFLADEMYKKIYDNCLINLLLFVKN